MNKELRTWMQDHLPTWLEAHDVMREVEALNGELRMYTWYVDTVKNSDIHWCETAACVCGYVAAKRGKPNQGGAENIAEDLDVEVEELVAGGDILVAGGGVLAQSIWAGSKAYREASLSDFGIPREHPLYSMNHITSDNPTPKDAADFIAALAEYVKGQTE